MGERHALSSPVKVSAGPEVPLDLAALIRSGDRSAFETLFMAHVTGLCAYANTLVHSKAVAEDIVQDVFCSIWARRTEWAVKGTVEAYLYAAVRHRAFRVLSRDRTERRWTDTTRLEMAEPGDKRTPDSVLTEADLDAIVARTVARFPQRVREVFLLVRREHLTYAQTAGRLEISAKTVEIHMGRALKALRAALAAHL